MDSSANSLINPDARMGLAGAQPGAGAAGTGQAGGAADLGGLGGNLGGNFGQRLSGLAQMRGNPRAPLIFAVALLVAIVAGLFLWSRAPDYKVLYSNLSDRDGGAIITALQAANIPYKFSDAGGAILVPAEQVHEMRLRLASQGLPKSGSVGFELMDNQKFGISQFAEQINYQRSLEGELERTVESISSVKSARVHLAIPKPSVFVRDKEAPSASVLVNLYPGRALDEGQVLAITHMVSSAVPDMPVKGVTILDQDGNLLTQPSTGSGLDASQLKYRQQIERNTQQRIDAILSPLFGSGNAHSQVSADIDFSHTEQTSENYGPNGNPQQSAIRSQQTSTATEMSQAGASGVPGALSNQPPQPASAPITASNGASGVTTTPVSDRKDSTTNYELNKTVQHLEQPMGGIKRLSVAVVVNYLRVVDAKGHATMQPVTADKLAQVTQLVKDAMGFDQARGDSVNLVNSPFTADVDPDADLPWWRTPDMIALAKQIATYLGIAAVALFLYFVMVKPALRRAFPPPEPVAAAALPSPDEPVLLDGIPAAERAGAPTVAELESDNELLALENSKHKYERNLEFARNIARQDPKIVATVVKNWVSDER
ncbi:MULTISPECIES: flagellar basal-body MS-ring/collar protein FliF [Paraburkholderia]|uniref:Flagellar M-ring protein n=1 Tax=Paraburkholderia aspalathi TaxID=1324617 RepID=A0A1I7EHV4_9BURK|nr:MULTISPECIES: flagellar basal-body MS-ring/collar protein FliF [Paraburkholderia]MCP2086384.1 flagellar M-ring protein FliF [Paraburkholderia sediminicola]MBK3822956.1 flagellar basal body M-ring protein FliF [Paraburkholderia aspalathi]MBK3835019.1 flagellar basal body M-ring protein FliF [Paraburkholderia aspalathi]MBK3841389.1 flagellar basal body M-ring protein FliF [Paraburkholderia aspalathi]MBK3864766.1 flagellar basal body M-ring protein FliF [Paraburkholderia aspalathi]